MTDLRQAAERVLNDCTDAVSGWQSLAPLVVRRAAEESLAELRAALAEPVQDHPCNPHPKAPHGYLRNASHTEDRYICECEYWDPYEAGYQAGCEAMLKHSESLEAQNTELDAKLAQIEATRAEPAALLTTWVSETEAVTEPLYKAPPPARRLTDSEISEVWFQARITGLTETSARLLIRAAERRLGGE